ncbi:hypothetical protein H2201_002474 [Coniosporium apollinis]|uniref:Telomeric repeat-binding factor 2-interacting protein 1 n=1 Tax=Coniosporium apollinis TaxID=61459 RepID=A0ABQ9NZ71_9PEZI|nr:hypothetical protein H2201_002474 [Coniosporium apollinis]
MTDSRAHITYGDLDETTDVRGRLFEGLKFWIAQRCPLRNTFVDMVKNNGGVVVPLEKLADYLIVDHARKDTPPGGISYRFIEQSIKEGRLEDPETHLVGQPVGTVRAVGSVQPKKGGRTPYTQADDLELYRWVKGCERQGCSVLGNEIYKQLEEKNPRHPWQSWRDRFVKYLQHRAPVGYSPQDDDAAPDVAVPTQRHRHEVNGHTNTRTQNGRSDATDLTRSRVQPGEESDVEHQVGRPRRAAPHGRAAQPQFTAVDFHEILKGAREIQDTSFEHYESAWDAWAEASKPGITASQWRTFYEKKVLPVYKVVRGHARRIRLYNESATAWTKLFPDGTADEWLDHYYKRILPRLAGLKDSAKGSNEDNAGGESPERPGAINRSPSPSPPTEAVPKRAPPKEAPLKHSLPREAPPREAPPSQAPSTQTLLQESPPTVAPPEESPLKEALPKEAQSTKDLPKEAPPKEPLSKIGQPKASPRNEVLPAEAPLKGAPPKETPTKQDLSNKAPQREPEPASTARMNGTHRRMSPSVVIPLRRNGGVKSQRSPLFVSDDASAAEESDTGKPRPMARAHEFFAVQYEERTKEAHPGADRVTLSKILLEQYKALPAEHKAAYMSMEAQDTVRWEREAVAHRASKKRVRESIEIAESPGMPRVTPNGKRRRLSKDDLAQLDGHVSDHVTPRKTTARQIIELSEDEEDEEDYNSDDTQIPETLEPVFPEQAQLSIEDDETLPEGFPPAGVYTHDEDEVERLAAMNDTDEIVEDAETAPDVYSSDVEEDQRAMPIETINEWLAEDKAAFRERRVEVLKEHLPVETINQLSEEDGAVLHEQEQYEEEKVNRVSQYAANLVAQHTEEEEDEADEDEEEEEEVLGRPASPTLSVLAEPIRPRGKGQQKPHLPSPLPLTSSPPRGPQSATHSPSAQRHTAHQPSSSPPDPTPLNPNLLPISHLRPPPRSHAQHRGPSSPPDPTPFDAPQTQSGPPSSHSRPQSPPTKPLEGRAVIAHIDALVSTGHDEEQVLASLYHGSTNPRLAAIVLASMEAGEGVPDDVPGVWTDEDDAVVGEVVDATDLSGGGGGLSEEAWRLVEKHGERRCRQRVGFLKLWKGEVESQVESQR